MLSMLMVFSCGQAPEDKCNEADAYLHETVESGGIWGSQAVLDVDDWGTCQNIAKGDDGVEYTTEAISDCSDYVDAWNTLHTCDEECVFSAETDEYKACQDDCQAEYDYDYTPNSPCGDHAECDGQLAVCEWACPGRSTWTCD